MSTKLITAKEAPALHIASDESVETYLNQISENIRKAATEGKQFLDIKEQDLMSLTKDVPVALDKICSRLTGLGFRVFWNDESVTSSGWGSDSNEPPEKYTQWYLQVQWGKICQ
jgi:hypothetical protein